MRKRFKNKILKCISWGLNKNIITGLIFLIGVIVLIVNKYILVTLNDFLDLTVFSTLVITILCAKFLRIITDKVNTLLEDQNKLESNYSEIINKYSEDKEKLIEYTNSTDSPYKKGRRNTIAVRNHNTNSINNDTYIYPITYEMLFWEKKIKKISFEDDKSNYKLPVFVESNFDKLFQAHSYSDIYNQIKIRLDDYTYNKNTLTLNTSRTTFYNSLVTNRAMDYKLGPTLSIRELYSMGPKIEPFKESLLSNHIGVDAFIETSDGDIIFSWKKKNNSIAKKTLGISVMSSMNTKYALNDAGEFTYQGLVDCVHDAIQHTLGIPQTEYSFIIEKNLIAFYRNLVEGGKPQFLLHIKCRLTTDELKEMNDIRNKEIKNSRKENKDKKEYSKLVFVHKERLNSMYLAPDLAVLDNKCYDMAPSTVACIVLFIKKMKYRKSIKLKSVSFKNTSAIKQERRVEEIKIEEEVKVKVKANGDEDRDKKMTLPIIGWCEDHIGILTAIASLLGIVITGVFQYLSYLYEKGFYDFWEIPIKYMEIDYHNLLMQFLLNFSAIIIIIAFGVIYINIYNNFKIGGRIFLNIFPVFFNILLLIYAAYRVGGTINDVLNFSNPEVLKLVIVVEVILYPMELIYIHYFKERKPKKEAQIAQKASKKIKKNRKSKKNSIVESNCSMDVVKKDEDKTEADENKDTFKAKEEKNMANVAVIIILCLLVYCIGVINWTGFLLYNDRKDKCDDNKRFEIIKDEEEQEYVVLSIYDSKYFVKPCIVSEEEPFIAINSDKYKLIEMVDNEVVIHDYGNLKDVFKLLNNEEYLLEKQNVQKLN